MKRNVIALFCLVLLCMASGKAQEQKLVYSYNMGSYVVTLLSEAQRVGKGDVLIDAPDAVLKKYIPDGTYASAVNAFLVETPDRTILVDAGFGTKLFENLQSAGKSPEDIDVILLTHMHGDHIGGLLRDGQKSFPNAALYIPQPEHDYWTSDEAMIKVAENRRGGFAGARKVIEQYKERLHLFTPGEAGGEQQILFPGIQPVAAYGHTPGHTGYLFESDGQKIFIWGDFVNVPDIQIPHPEIATVHDVQPQIAAETRKKLLNYLSKNNLRIAGMHIPYPGIIDLTTDQEGRVGFKLLSEE